jgi:diguanylate cyclase (GGDEF)-like protein
VRAGLARLAGKPPDLVGFAALVEIDPVLTGAVTRIVRCPVYAPAAQPLDLARAVSTIGRDSMERLLRSTPLVERAPETVERACRLWTHGLAVAAAARFLANQGALDAPEEAHLAGLVHDVAGFASLDGEDAGDAAARAESIVAGWRLGPRIAAVARRRPSFIEGVPVAYGDGDPDEIDAATARLVAVVARGAERAVRLGYGGCSEEADVAPADPESCAVLEAIELELAHAADLLGFAPPPRGGFVAALAAAETSARAELGDPPRAPVRALSTAGLAALHRELADVRGMTAVQDVRDRGLREIHARLGYDRLLLLEPDPASPGTLKACVVLDPTGLDAARGQDAVEFPSSPGGVVVRAFDTETAGRGGDAGEDAAALDWLGVSSFAAAPLRCGPSKLGVVVADRFLTDAPVDADDVEALAMSCSSLGLVVENAALDAAVKLLRSLSEKDDLTGLGNRRSVLVEFRREIDRARRYGKPLSLVMLDVDHFKSWNDAYGHQVGDEILRTASQIISSVSRDIDLIGRYGGEEFLVVLPETPVEQAANYAERLRATIEAHGPSLAERFPGAFLTVSAGVSSMCRRGDDADKLIQRADAALYAAKRNGRNRVCVDVASVAPPAG